jgi:hypothetical protein
MQIGSRLTHKQLGLGWVVLAETPKFCESQLSGVYNRADHLCSQGRAEAVGSQSQACALGSQSELLTLFLFGIELWLSGVS